MKTISNIYNFFVELGMKILHCERSVITYLFWGGTAALLNLVLSTILTPIFQISSTLTFFIAWFICCLYSFITEKIFVFNNHNQNYLQEFVFFLIGRLGSLIIGEVLTYLGYDIFKLNYYLVWFVVEIVVATINYFLGKIIVFKK